MTKWWQLIPEDEWAIYEQVIDAAEADGIPFALGGAFAVATFTGSWRNTKDLDLYVLPADRDRMVGLLTRLGFKDYYDTLPYDRWWIYRATREGAIIDVIWAMANHRAQIDELWMSGPEERIRGRCLRVLPAEALFWDKLYIMQRDRCDWPDVLNLLYAAGPDMKWDYLLRRIDEDWPLVAGALSVFCWIAPGHARMLPGWLWGSLGIMPPPEGPVEDIVKRRVDLLDTRPWFGPDRQRLQPAA